MKKVFVQRNRGKSEPMQVAISEKKKKTVDMKKAMKDNKRWTTVEKREGEGSHGSLCSAQTCGGVEVARLSGRAVTWKALRPCFVNSSLGFIKSRSSHPPPSQQDGWMDC
ncbi:hypothetical protein E2C01_034925 [Portunus trituberculatus]|uniref:Uncharacterized protein n=1 Tax=Portunus trituberculatus TaxID=210409 RepID=A0A5B7F720_PORTR|nr:hypothetical protein [Portunus trituberculatus]